MVPSYAACNSGGDQFSNNGKVLIHVLNASNAAINVTIGSQVVCDQGVTHNTLVNVTNAAVGKILGPFPTTRYNDASGYVQLAYSAVTSVTINAIEA